MRSRCVQWEAVLRSRFQTTLMAKEKAVGHHLSKRLGAGDGTSAYGGSLHLPTASLKNMQLARASEQTIQDLDRARVRKRMAADRQIMDLTKEMKNMELKRAELGYFDQRVFEKTLKEKRATYMHKARTMYYKDAVWAERAVSLDGLSADDDTRRSPFPVCGRCDFGCQTVTPPPPHSDSTPTPLPPRRLSRTGEFFKERQDTVWWSWINTSSKKTWMNSLRNVVHWKEIQVYTRILNSRAFTAFIGRGRLLLLKEQKVWPVLDILDLLDYVSRAVSRGTSVHCRSAFIKRSFSKKSAELLSNFVDLKVTFHNISTAYFFLFCFEF